MKRMLADVLWEAANVWLAVTEDDHRPRGGIYRESCCAVLQVIRPDWFGGGDDFDSLTCLPALAFLARLGCDPHTDYFLDNYDSREDGGCTRQGARYMWLLLAMHFAEDEGLEVEVPA